MLAMMKYKGYLEIGARLEARNMQANAKKMYRAYVIVAGIYDSRINVLEKFYGKRAVADLKIASYEEALNKALLAEYLKKLYKRLDGFRANWNNKEASSATASASLISFLGWCQEVRAIATSDIAIIKEFLLVLDNVDYFNIKVCDSDLSLLEVVLGVLNGELLVNSTKGEVQWA